MKNINGYHFKPSAWDHFKRRTIWYFRSSTTNSCLNKKKWYGNNDTELTKNCITWALNGKEDTEKHDCVITKILYQKPFFQVIFNFKGYDIWLPLNCCNTSLSSLECSSSKCPCSIVTVPRSFMHIGQRKPSLTSAAVAILKC